MEGGWASAQVDRAAEAWTLTLSRPQEKLPAMKVAGDWHTSERALKLYRESYSR